MITEERDTSISQTSQLTSLLTGDLLPRDLSFRPLLDILLLLLLRDGLLLLLLQPVLLGLLPLHLVSRNRGIMQRGRHQLLQPLIEEIRGDLRFLCPSLSPNFSSDDALNHPRFNRTTDAQRQFGASHSRLFRPVIRAIFC